MRLIDADALIKEIHDIFTPYEEETVKRALQYAPTVDRPQGEWKKRLGSINCSVCKRSNWSDSFEYTVRRFKFCPNCGARMKGVGDEID